MNEESERDSIRGNSNWCDICVYIYVWRYVWHNSSICHTYIMWVELDHSHFLYVPAVSNLIIPLETAQGFKIEPCACVCVKYPVFCLQHYYCSKNKPILYLDMVYCKFLLYVSIEVCLASSNLAPKLTFFT